MGAVIAKRRSSKRRRREAIEGYLFALPWILGFLVFTLGPMIASFLLSFTQYDILTESRWIGAANYIRMFKEDQLFWKSLYNTGYWVFIGVPLRLAAALGTALLLNQRIRGVAIFRTMYYVPSVVSGVALAMLWVWLFEPSIGLINTFLKLLGVQNVPLWLGSEVWSKPALIIMSLWGVGGSMVIFLAGLQDVPEQLYEAAIIDGATSWSRFWRITAPLLTPSIFFNLIMGIIGSFQVFTQAYVMTRGGPLYSTYFYVLHLYNEGFMYMHMGYASALAWFLFLIVLIFTLIQLWSSKRWVYYERI